MDRLSSGRRSALFSVATHGAALAVFLLLTRLHGPVLAPEHMPGTAQGTVQISTFQLLGAPPGAKSAKPREQKQGPARPQPVKTTVEKAKQLSQPAVAAVDGNAGEGSLGDGDMSIALVQFHPRPEPDLSTLPPGTSGDIVLDALIDAQGRIAHLSVSRSLGPSVDEQVIATVQQWTFTPAMRNGTPIASEQEILFHYERKNSG
jgi:periplasmic protein TonB